MSYFDTAAVTRWLVATLAVVIGYVILALLSTVVQEVWLGGVSYVNSPTNVLILAGIFTPIAGLIAGFVTAAVARRAATGAVIALVILIAAETLYLFGTGRVDGPLWFEAGAGATLAAAVVLGGWLWRLTFPQTGPAIRKS